VESGKTISYGHDMSMIKIERLYLKGGWMVKKRSNHRLLYLWLTCYGSAFFCRYKSSKKSLRFFALFDILNIIVNDL
jgi:hypothetical protein